MTPQDADLTAVVLSWNTRERTRAALAALPAAAAPLRARVVCVDNASGDGTAAAVRATLPDVLVLENARNLGFARGNATALPHLRGRVVVFLNSDTVAAPGSLAHLVAYLDARPRVGIACPRLVGADGAAQRSAWGTPSPLGLLQRLTPLGWTGAFRARVARERGPRRPEPTSGAVETVTGACLAIRRDLCDALRGFDPGYPFYFEDVDLCWRARTAGYEVHVVADGPPVVHEGGAATALAGGAMRLPYLQGALRFVRRSSSPRTARAFAVALKVGAPVRAAADACLAPLRAAVRAASGRPADARRALALGRERLRFLERDVGTFLRS